MKIARFAIIFATLAFAGLAGTSSNGVALQSAACRVDAFAAALSGASGSAICRR